MSFFGDFSESVGFCHTNAGGFIVINYFLFIIYYEKSLQNITSESDTDSVVKSYPGYPRP